MCVLAVYTYMHQNMQQPFYKKDIGSFPILFIVSHLHSS